MLRAYPFSHVSLPRLRSYAGVVRQRAVRLLITGMMRGVLAAAALFTAGVSARDSVSFDFGWKHRTGLTEKAVWDDPPPLNPDP
eukprot:COSAG02_NODE_27452_length_609_cov_1.149020_1_plen_83_part_10